MSMDNSPPPSSSLPLVSWVALLLISLLTALAAFPGLLFSLQPAVHSTLHAQPSSCPECEAYQSAREAVLGDTEPRAFSSYTCTAGSQTFDKPWHVFTHNYKEPSWLGYRVCHARDVCVQNGQLHFYTDPQLEARLPTGLRLATLVASGFLYRGAYEGGVGDSLKPAVVAGPRPPTLPYAPPSRLYLATALNNAQNYAHLLTDTVLPAFAAAELHGLRVEDVQHIGLTTCANFQNSGWRSKAGVPFSDSCRGNFERWYAALMPHPYLDMSPGSQGGGMVCFKHLLLGQDAAFSGAMFGGQFERARAVRGMRRQALSYAFEGQAAGAAAAAAPPSQRTLLVLQQHNPVNAPTALGDICALALGAAPPAQPVLCEQPGNQTVRAQVRSIASARVLLCEHGSTCYAALFAPPGAAVVVVVPDSATAAKEGHVLLFLPDIHVLFVSEASARSRGELAAVLELALLRSEGRGAAAEAAQAVVGQ